MQIKAYLHRYSVSSSRFFIRPTQGIFVPSKIAVLKIAAFHCSFGVIHSTNGQLLIRKPRLWTENFE